jgi:hypothetical protein
MNLSCLEYQNSRTGSRKFKDPKRHGRRSGEQRTIVEHRAHPVGGYGIRRRWQYRRRVDEVRATDILPERGGLAAVGTTAHEKVRVAVCAPRAILKGWCQQNRISHVPLLKSIGAREALESTLKAPLGKSVDFTSTNRCAVLLTRLCNAMVQHDVEPDGYSPIKNKSGSRSASSNRTSATTANASAPRTRRQHCCGVTATENRIARVLDDSFSGIRQELLYENTYNLSTRRPRSSR